MLDKNSTIEHVKYCKGLHSTTWNLDLQSQTAATAYFLFKQLLLFAFVRQHCTIIEKGTGMIASSSTLRPIRGG